MSDDKLPPLDKVIAACKIGFNSLDLAAAAWLERQQAEIEQMREAEMALINCPSRDAVRAFLNRPRADAMSDEQK